MGKVLKFPTRGPITSPYATPRAGGYMDWANLLTDYMQSLDASGRSPGTMRLHRVYLLSLSRAVPDPLTATTTDIEAWMAMHTWKPETRRAARAAVVGFYRWALREDRLAVSPAAKLAPIRPPRAVARPAPEAVFADAMLRGDRRVQLMLMLARYAGLRAGEIARVHSADLDGDLLYVAGKGGVRRVVPVSKPELIAAIRDANGWLFPSRRGDHLTPSTVTVMLSRHLPDGWTAHTLRHAFATRAYAAHPDLLALGQVLGHASPETTRRYVAVEMDALRAVAQSAA